MNRSDTAVGEILALLADRADNATICPSEVARRLARDNPRGWRAQMPIVHEAVDHLVAQAVITLSWKGRRLARRCGPYRIRRGARDGIDPILAANPNAD